jgi:hypothetical protein
VGEPFTPDANALGDAARIGLDLQASVLVEERELRLGDAPEADAPREPVHR